MMSFERSFILAVKTTFVIFLAISLYVCFAKFHAYILYCQIKKNIKIYAYDNLGKNINCALYASNLSNGLVLKKIYEDEKKGINTCIPFEIKTISITKPVFLLDYENSDSSIIKFIDVDTSCWGYYKGYICSETMHYRPPADSLIKNFQDFYRNYETDHPPGFYKKISDYGFYCDCDN